MSSSSAIRILCQEDASETLDVSAEEVELLKEKSDYFRAMFEHGTVEVGTQTILKPTWSRETAKHIVSLICKSKTAVKNPKEIKNLLIASNEILVDVEINGRDECEFTVNFCCHFTIQ